MDIIRKTRVAFKCVVEQIETDQGMEWYATYPEFPGVCGGGKTEQEAVDDLAENLLAHIDLARDETL